MVMVPGVTIGRVPFVQSGSAGAVVPPAGVGRVLADTDIGPADEPAAPFTALAHPVSTSPAHKAVANDQRRRNRSAATQPPRQRRRDGTEEYWSVGTVGAGRDPASTSTPISRTGT
ncbi:MAG TPA: hypothetical protein VIJ00_08930, partial [Nakamurella sp.]